jgi:Asp-tRNA(Asn)/Glu-tRNA(Gln) amidotransferase C subunit
MECHNQLTRLSHQTVRQLRQHIQPCAVRKLCSSRRRVPQIFGSPQSRQSSSASTQPPANHIAAILSQPTWSVSSLLPPPASGSELNTPVTPSSSSPSPASEEVTPQTLRHLLRLSSLPPPRNSTEEAALLSTLHRQLHFVRAIQAVDTSGVEPLRSIRDESAEGIAAATIGLAEVAGALAQETTFGYRQRPRRDRTVVKKGEKEGDGANGKWDPLAGAEDKAGRFFVVRTSKGRRGDEW